MILPLDLDDQIAKRATARAHREGYADLSALIRLLVYRYAYGKDSATGGLQRAANMTPDERTGAAQVAALARWEKATPEERQASAKHASDARWGPQQRALKLARTLTAPKRKRVQGWPLSEEED